MVLTSTALARTLCVLLTLVFPCKLHGAAYGKGIYLSPISSISFGYSGKRLSALPSLHLSVHALSHGICKPHVPLHVQVQLQPARLTARPGSSVCWGKGGS